jgi:hypothetical protein
MKLPQSIIDFKSRLDRVIAEEQALRSKRSNERICAFLKAEKNRRCSGGAPLGMGEQPPPLAGPTEEEIRESGSRAGPDRKSDQGPLQPH